MRLGYNQEVELTLDHVNASMRPRRMRLGYVPVEQVEPNDYNPLQ